MCVAATWFVCIRCGAAPPKRSKPSCMAIPRSSRVIGRRVEDIALPEGASIGCIVRGEDVLMAHHDTVVQADDHVILFITDRRHVEQVERLFLGEIALGRR